MKQRFPDEEPDRGVPPGPPELVPPEVFHALNDAVEGSRRAVFLTEAVRTQTVLALWDTVVVDEGARGRVPQQGDRAERAFAIHLAGLLQVTRNRAVTLLHTAVSLRALPVSYGAFLTGAFGWQAAEAIVRGVGALSGDARDGYDLAAARLAGEVPPQLLDARLTRLHDSLDHQAATDRGAAAHRDRRVTARPGPEGMGVLTVTGPETDIAALYETAHKAAVTAHGITGEDRTVRQLMYDTVLDLLLGGYTIDPANITRNPDGSFTPATPFERLGDPRVPGRKVIAAQIIVTVPAATVAGAADAPGTLHGWGSLPAAETRRIVATARYWTRAELDPIDGAILAFDSHERAIPTGLRRLIWLRSGTCDEPGCPTGAHRCDLDHVIRVEHGGHTTEINLSALCRGGHQTKDDGYIDVERTPTGHLIWHTTRWGGHFTKHPETTIRRRPTTPDDTHTPFDTAA